MIRTLIVDDEPLARQILRQMLAAHAGIEIVGEAASGTAAVRDIRTLRPDLVLLDIQMPGMNGLDVLRALEPEPLPHVIFVTAHDAYALRAFEVHALDYLLKPFDEQRLDAALSRVRARRSEQERGDRTVKILELLESMRRTSAWPQRVAVKRADRTLLLPIDAIDLIEAEGKVLHITANAQKYSLRETLYQFASILDPDRFLRISRSAIVNVASIEEIMPWSRGEYLVVLKGGERVATTRRYRGSLVRLLEPEWRASPPGRNDADEGDPD